MGLRSAWMASPRPTFIDLQDARAPSSASARYDRISPRIQHYDGDIPPALSPLDAFAAHSRKLARELEETRKAGERRLSRLPPQHITQSLSEHQQNRPQIFRQLSSEADVVPPLPQKFRSDSGNNPQVLEPYVRPQSSYPRHSAVLKLKDEEEDEGRSTPTDQLAPRDYFGIPTSDSPPPLERNTAQQRVLKDNSHHDLVQSPTSPHHPDLTFTLAPPNAGFARKPYQESSDDDYTSSNTGSTFSQARKLSSSSGVSGPLSPASPYLRSHQRTPSNNSMGSLSASGSRKGASHLNFSRPMSSSSLNGLNGLNINTPTRQASKSSIASALPALPTPSNSFDETRSEISDGYAQQSSSYTHRTFTLPRGRKSDRTSALFLPLTGPDFIWHEPMFPGTPPLEARPSVDLAVPSDAIPRPSQNTQRSDFSFDFAADKSRPFALDDRRPSSSDAVPSSSKQVSGLTGARPSTSHAATAKFKHPPPPVPTEARAEIDASSRSDSTIRPTTARSISNYQAYTPDEHVEKAIDLHQNGDLKESTYHLRIAAKKDHPTGMLLYALACRHGWGMRANPTEGVNWLRKAVDSAMLEVADDEAPESTSDKPRSGGAEKKTHRAQFALAIYELGQCHLNGWGMEQDKSLALRCFEIAGNWGDTDALTEAGFCYAEGIGCKKNLKKAAKFYRIAEKKGVSMVGNSWYVSCCSFVH